MKISVIIPSYGHPDYLENSIESVKNQTFKDWELIVVDDNNPDTDARNETETLLKKEMISDDRIKYIQHEKNKNGAVARNTGFAAANGEYISLLDSDDEYLPTRLEKCLSVMENEPKNIAGVYTGCEFRRKGKKYFESTKVCRGNHLTTTLACTFGFFTGSNIFVRKEIVDELNGFDPSFLRHQDYEFLARLFIKYELAAIPEILVIKNNEGFNVPNVQKTISIKEQYLAKFSDTISRLPKNQQDFIFFKQFLAIAEDASREGNIKTANHYYRKARQYGCLSITEWKRRFALPFVRFCR